MVGRSQIQTNVWIVEGQIHIVDLAETRSVHCRYSPALLTSGRLAIGTANLLGGDPTPNAIMMFDDPAINRRIQWVVMNAVGDYQVMQGNAEEDEQENKESNDFRVGDVGEISEV